MFSFANFAIKDESKENGISFEGQGKKWGNAEEGTPYFVMFSF